MKISSNWERQIPVAEFQLVLLSGYVLVGSGGRVSGRTGSHEGNEELLCIIKVEVVWKRYFTQLSTFINHLLLLRHMQVSYNLALLVWTWLGL